MKVSIITACFNSVNTLRRTVLSVLSQTHQDWELLIMDGNSSDGTLESIADLSDPRIHVACERDRGIYDAMNKGLQKAKGEIIGFLNSDDHYSGADVLSLVESVIVSGASGCYGGVEFFERLDPSRISRVWKPRDYTPVGLYFGWMPPHPTLYLRRDVAKAVGMFNLRRGSAADYEYVLRVFRSQGNGIQNVGSVMVKMQRGGASDLDYRVKAKAWQQDMLSWHQVMRWPNPLLFVWKPVLKLGQYWVRNKAKNHFA